MYNVSVIIPVFNAEHFIEKCCDSLFSQSLTNIEYVFVNDGSTDNSVDVIRKVLVKYPSRKNDVIIVDRKQNRGVAHTRQEGLDNATGEYVIHCDADDWIECDMYEALYNKAKQDNADVVCCNYVIDSIGKPSKIVSFPKDEFRISFNLSPIRGSLVNKLVRRNLIISNQITFEKDINWGEDFLFSTKCQILANRVSIIHKAFYHYIQNEGSITHTISLSKYLQLIKCGVRMEHFLVDNGLSKKYELELNYMKFQLKQRFLRDQSLRNIKKWKETYPECNQFINLYPSASYLKLSARMIDKGYNWMGLGILKVYDLYNKFIR